MLTQTPSTEKREVLLENAINTVEEYVQSICPNADIVDEVYHLLGGSSSIDNAENYQYACVDLLAALADPAIGKQLQSKMGGNSYEILIEMISNMRSFCRVMCDDYFEALLDANRLKNDDESLWDEGIRNALEEYTKKLNQVKNNKAN